MLGTARPRSQQEETLSLHIKTEKSDAGGTTRDRDAQIQLVPKRGAVSAVWRVQYFFLLQ